MASELGQKLHELYQEGTIESKSESYNLWVSTKLDGTNDLAMDSSLTTKPWQEIIQAAESANAPGQFTAFIGYEWSSLVDGNNLHRVVVYRDGGDKARTRIPLSSELNPDPEALWDWMEKYEKETGGRLLAIPHNGNLSNGLMFDDITLTDKRPLDRTYAENRRRWEPLLEVTQMKGDGETHPFLSPNDEFSDFETWDKGSFGLELKTQDMLPREYAREALKRGLAYKEKIGVNPFKFGLIGSTDAHTSLPTTNENNFFGKVTQLEPSADPIRFEEPITGRLGEKPTGNYARETSASGLVAVWANENTRERIFEAMQRKEMYATTGTRLRVRVFAGYDFKAEDIEREDFVDYGYSKGVPMGSDLNNDNGATPQFLVRATKDPDGANLDRVQIIKGWVDANGETQERIYDVAVSDDRSINADGRCTTPVGTTVDVANASYTNTIGETMLFTYWEDPDFNSDLDAFYYVRVLEIPTPRWTTYDAKYFGIDIPEDVATSIQDRAYTSPIWYNAN